LLNRAQSVVFGHQGVLVSDQDPLKLLPLPWRSNNIKYASNEIYLDVIESIDATLDSEGRVLNSAVHGVIEVNSRLSGMPDISLSLSNSHLIEEYSFHPSVRLSRFAADRVVSFVPADGVFTLMSYKVRPPAQKDPPQWQPRYIKQNAWAQSQISGGMNAGSNATQVPLPLYIRPQATFGATQGRVSIVCGTKPAFEKPVESVSLEVRLPGRVASADPSATRPERARREGRRRRRRAPRRAAAGAGGHPRQLFGFGGGDERHQGGDAAGAQREVQAQPGRAVSHQGG
jgi:AP-3 complex subunit mu